MNQVRPSRKPTYADVVWLAGNPSDLGDRGDVNNIGLRQALAKGGVKVRATGKYLSSGRSEYRNRFIQAFWLEVQGQVPEPVPRSL